MFGWVKDLDDREWLAIWEVLDIIHARMYRLKHFGNRTLREGADRYSVTASTQTHRTVNHHGSLRVVNNIFIGWYGFKNQSRAILAHCLNLRALPGLDDIPCRIAINLPFLTTTRWGGISISMYPFILFVFN